MSNFFHGWRRKLGCVTLVMAGVFTGMWVRSWYCQDEVTLSRNSRFGILVSNRGCLIWRHGSSWNNDKNGDAQFPKQPFKMDWKIGSARRELAEMFTTDLEPSDEGRFRFGGLDFGFVRGRITANYGWTESVYLVPYTYVVLPVALLSVFLMLGKPKRNAPIANSTEAPHE